MFIRPVAREGGCKWVQYTQLQICMHPLGIYKISKTNILIRRLKDVWQRTASTFYICFTAMVGNNSFFKNECICKEFCATFALLIPCIVTQKGTYVTPKNALFHILFVLSFTQLLHVSAWYNAETCRSCVNDSTNKI